MFALVDCNNFYVSCERLFKPNLEGKPVVVLSNNDGCIISRSQEAKDLGIKMGTPAFVIDGELKKHNIISFSSNYALYGDLSRRVMETIKSFVNETEVYFVNEAFVNMKLVPNNPDAHQANRCGQWMPYHEKKHKRPKSGY